MGRFFAFVADSSRALQACGQRAAFAVQVAVGRPLARSACRASTLEAKNPRATGTKPAGLRTPARQGLAMVAQWFHRLAEAEGVDRLRL
jgi:hypothetical protein